ncbi:MAG: 30S ribosomal protein S4, partial [Flavobacteriales bacterium]|nr:30S ribosomal protein S4 [Flavobacteriales bacterium]
DEVAVREKSKSLEVVDDSIANRQDSYEWMTWNSETKTGRYVSVPERTQIPENIQEHLIVELYSK